MNATTYRVPMVITDEFDVPQETRTATVWVYDTGECQASIPGILPAGWSYHLDLTLLRDETYRVTSQEPGEESPDEPSPKRPVEGTLSVREPESGPSLFGWLRSWWNR